MSKPKGNTLFVELDTVIHKLSKMFDEDQQPPARRPEDEEEDDQNQNPDEGSNEGGDEGSEDENSPMDQREDERERNPQMQNLNLSFRVPRTPKERNDLVKALNTLNYTNQTKKNIVGSQINEHGQNFIEDGINDQDVEGASKYDDYDQGYGGTPPMNPKLMPPKEYEALYNQILADSHKGPSIGVTTVKPEQAYDSKKSFGGDSLVDVTPFVKSLDGRFESMNASVTGLAQMVGKLTESQIATAKALTSIMSKSQGPKSVQQLNKGMAPVAPQVTSQQLLPMLEKGVAEGRLSPIEQTKFEMSGGQMTPAIQAYLQTEGGLR